MSYLRIEPEHGCIEIGHIWFGAGAAADAGGDRGDLPAGAPRLRRPRQPPARVEVRRRQRALAPRGRALRLHVRGRVPPAHDRQGPQPRHGLVLDRRRRVAGRARGASRPGCARRTSTPKAVSGRPLAARLESPHGPRRSLWSPERVRWNQVSRSGVTRRSAATALHAVGSAGATTGEMDLGWLWRDRTAHLHADDLSLTLSPVPSAGGSAGVWHFAKSFAAELRSSTFADLELVVSELETNAIEHGRGSIRLKVTQTDRRAPRVRLRPRIRLRLRAARLRRLPRQRARAGDIVDASRHGMGHPPRQHAGLVRDQPSLKVIISSRLVRSKMRWTSGGAFTTTSPEVLETRRARSRPGDGDAAHAKNEHRHRSITSSCSGLERRDRGDQVGRGGDVELALDRDRGDRAIAVGGSRTPAPRMCRSSGCTLAATIQRSSHISSPTCGYRSDGSRRDDRGGHRAGQLPQRRVRRYSPKNSRRGRCASVTPSV